MTNCQGLFIYMETW